MSVVVASALLAVVTVSNEFLLLVETDDLDRVRRDIESEDLRARIARSGIVARSVYYPEA